MIAKYIVLSNIISFASNNILRNYMYSGTLLILKKLIVLLHTLSAYNSILVCYKVYSSDPRELVQAEGMLKPIKNLLIQYYVERIL